MNKKKHQTNHDLSHTDFEVHRIRETYLNSSQQTSGTGIWDWDIVSGDLHWSDRIWQLLGYDKEITETSYDNFLEAVHPDDRENVIRAVYHCIEHGAAYNIEHRVIWSDGSVHWVQENGVVIRTKDGSQLRMLGLVSDINARKCFELALTKLTK